VHRWNGTDGQSKDAGELRVTRIETISDGEIDEDKLGWVSGISEEQAEKYKIRKGDILFSHINSDPHIGKTAIAPKDYVDLLHGMNLLLLRANPKVIEPHFLHLVCRYYREKGVFVKICSRSVNQSSINQGKLKALEIPMPPLAEQHNIVSVLSLACEAIGQQEKPRHTPDWSPPQCQAATFPRVMPCPYMAISKVPGGKTFADEPSSPTGVIFSSVSYIVQ
jgi:hypothetical protein